MVPDSGGPIVDPHEVGVLSEFGDEFAYAVPLSYSSYHSDGHEALLRGCVNPVGNFVQSFAEVPNMERFPEPPVSICFRFLLRSCR
jgi:hypothetical protein